MGPPHQWSEATCTCDTAETEDLAPDTGDPAVSDGELERDDEDDDDEWLTRELVVIGLLSTINTCLLVITSLLVRRLRTLGRDMKTLDSDASVNCYQVSGDQEDSYLRGPKLVSNNTYSELDIYSASSGFVSEDGSTGRGQEQGPRVEAVYETAESVRLKKYQLKESYQDQDQFTYEKAMQSIDETMKMLTESANKL